MAGGRPTKYDPAFCDAVVEHCKTGASLTSFAASIDVARSTINQWAEQNAEFSEAVKRAKAHCAAWWEQNARNAAMGANKDANPTLCIFGLKNMAAEDWRDKQEMEHSGGVKYERVERLIVDPAGSIAP
jgi:transposase